MSSMWNDPDREPTPPDPELEALARLFRDHPPPEPSAQAWRQTLARAEARLTRTAPTRSRWPFLAGLIAAAMIGGVVLARALWPTPAALNNTVARSVPTEDDEPFAVATLSEVNIFRMDPADADRIVLGQPLIGTMEFLSPEEVDLVKIDPDPEAGRLPLLQRNAGGPMVIVARAEPVHADDDDDEH